MNSDNSLTLGFDLDKWHGYGVKSPVTVDISPQTNSHIILSGMSGSGKSYAEQQIIARLALAQPGGEFFFADFKGDDTFSYLRGCPRYYSYRNTLNALNAVYDRLKARLSGEDETRHPVTLIWDEYMANILSLINADKKTATAEMNKIAEILLMGRSMSVRLSVSCQRPDAIAFPVGSRLNYGVVVVLGAAVRSIYEMLMPDFIEDIKGRQFGRGEGVVLLQGSELRFIKIPTINDEEHMRNLCAQALSS